MTSRRRRRDKTVQESSITPSVVGGNSGYSASIVGQAQPPAQVSLPRPRSPPRRQRGLKEQVEVSTVPVGPQPASQERTITSHTVKRGRTGLIEEETSSAPLVLDEATAKRVRWDTHTTPSEPLPDLFSGLSLTGQDNDPDYLAWSDFDNALPETELDPVSSMATPKVPPLVEWRLHHREIALREIIRLEGRGDERHESCPCGGSLKPVYRCLHCFGQTLRCGRCTVHSHQQNPFHVVEEWHPDTCEFTRRTLTSLGLQIQLGHPVGEDCPNPVSCYGNSFSVIHSNGLHTLSLQFCGCTFSQPHWVQLIRSRMYPGSFEQPRLAATFEALHFLHTLNFAAKTSPFEYHTVLNRLTDNSGSKIPKDWYSQLLTMFRQWRHLKMLKRSGRYHEPGGISATKDGDLAIRCPACPQPGRNLPSVWRDVPYVWMWLFALFIALDANFKLRRKKVSTPAKDPSLSGGWAYFVNEEKFSEHLKEHGNTQQPRSNCVNHSAVNNADQGSKDLSYTGIGTCDDSRHNFKRPNSVGELHAGERYSYMDFFFLSSLIGHDEDFVRLVVSYDIVCQWWKNLGHRMRTYKREIIIDDGELKYVFLVPKFHLPVHIAECGIMYSFHLKPGVAHTDGEAPERGWADVNHISAQAKESGPGAFHDLLNDHFGDWNWGKVIDLDSQLLRKLRIAAVERREHLLVFKELDGSLSDREQVEQWSQMARKWENDAQNENPYERKMDAPSLQKVRQRLAEEEAAKSQGTSSNSEASHSEWVVNISPSELITRGIQLESEKFRMNNEEQELRSKGHPTPKQLADHQLSINRLVSRIESWIQAQMMFMPQAAQLRLNDSLRIQPSKATFAEGCNISLWLPSEVLRAQTKMPLDHPQYLMYKIDSALLDLEFGLREGQAWDALAELRSSLRFKSQAVRFKVDFIAGVHATTRAMATLQKIQQRIDGDSNLYRAAWDALCVLGPSLQTAEAQVAWSATPLRQLKPQDIRMMNEDDKDSHRQTEGTRTTSWIWTTTGISSLGDDLVFDEALRIEWCRCRARTMRWQEDVELLPEEMRRVLAYFSWEIALWKHRIKIADGEVEPAMREAVVAYATRQASIRQALRTRFVQTWRYVPNILRWTYRDMKHEHDVGKEGWSAAQSEPPFVREMLQELDEMRPKMAAGNENPDATQDPKSRMKPIGIE